MRYFIPLLAKESSKRVGSIVLLLAAIASFASPANAEGSKDLISSGGDRPYLEYQNAASFFIGSIPRRNVIKVYAKVGETISLGSSAIGVNSAKILYRKPNGVSSSCDGTSGGLIQNRNAELAGPAHPLTNPLVTPATAPHTGPFQPCNISVAATEEGIWEIEFESPGKGTNNPAPIAASADWLAQANTDSWVTAWDVTVRNSSGIAQPGRAFANYLALNLGGNSRALSSRVYIQTIDGYGYTIDMNEIDPFGFAFFANNKGFQNAGNPIYRSLQLSGANPGSMPSGYSIQFPNNADNSATRDFTHKIFFNTTNTANTPNGGPDTTMPTTASSPTGSTWLFKLPDPPPTPTDLNFRGVENTLGAAGTSPLGGNFTFTSTSPSAYSIVIDLNGDGIYGNTGLVNGISISDRYILGTAGTGTNTVFWDGKDQNGVTVPASANTIKAIVTQYAGEIHFPFLDPENNPKGLIIQRVRDPGTAAAPTAQVFYDDRFNAATNNNSLCSASEGTTANCYGTPPSPRQALGGVNSATGAHAWSNNFGDIRGMDTWAYYPSAATQTVNGFVIREADLLITKTDNLTTIAAGSAITYTIQVKNNGPSDADNASVKDTLPSQLSNVNWSCTASTGSSCGTSNGTGNIDIKVNLKNGGTATITVNAIVNVSATGTLQNTATVLRPDDVNDPTDPNRLGAGNNSATDTTTITAPVPRLRLVKRITALNAISYTDTIDDPSDPNDDSSIKWTTNYLTGRTGKSLTAADTVPVKPGDTLEYTIYFLSDGGIPAQNVTLCDLVPANTTFVANAFNGNTPTDGGTPGADSGMRLTLGSSTVYLSNGADAPDRGQFFTPGTSAPCGNNGASIVVPNGAVTVNLGNVTNATAPGTPNSFGFIRFRAKVK